MVVNIPTLNNGDIFLNVLIVFLIIIGEKGLNLFSNIVSKQLWMK